MKKLTLAAALLGFSGLVNAGIITQEAQSGYMDTDFQDYVLTFNQFDNKDGLLNLESVEFSLNGQLLNTTRIENFGSNGGSTINVIVSALLKLESEVGHELVTTLPSALRTFTATAFDGAVDWSGTSGFTFEDTHSKNSTTVKITDPDIMDLFVGTGKVNTLMSAFADTRVSGGGNVFAGFSTDAQGSVKVAYNYSEPTVSVDEPHVVALMGLALMGFAVSRRKKSA